MWMLTNRAMLDDPRLRPYAVRWHRDRLSVTHLELGYRVAAHIKREDGLRRQGKWAAGLDTRLVVCPECGAQLGFVRNNLPVSRGRARRLLMLCPSCTPTPPTHTPPR